MHAERPGGQGLPDREEVSAREAQESEPPVIRLTPAVWEVMRERDVREIGEGQIWRLQWLDTVALGVVLPRREAAEVVVFPLTEDPQFATDYDLVLEPDETPFGTKVLVQIPLEMVVHERVLERWLGQIEETAWKDLLRLREAFKRSETPDLPEGRVGPPVVDELDERLLYRTEQREAQAPLQFSDWLPSPEPSSASDVRDIVRRWLAQPGREPKELQRLSGVSVQKLVRLTRDAPVDLTSSEVMRLGEALGRDVSSPSEHYPEELVETLDDPRLRPCVWAAAARWDTDEADARRRVARHLVGAPRRTTGEMTREDWERLLIRTFGDDEPEAHR